MFPPALQLAPLLVLTAEAFVPLRGETIATTRPP
jgi:hypothetical protein